METQAFNTG